MNSQFNYEQGYFCDKQATPENASLLFQSFHCQEDNFWSQSCLNFDQIVNQKSQKPQNKSEECQKDLIDISDQDQEDKQKINVQKSVQQSIFRVVNQIQTSPDIIKNRNQAIKGEKDDTGSLNRNLKSIILKFFSEGLLLNLYNEKEKLILMQFKKENSASFKLLKKLIEQTQQFGQFDQNNLKNLILSFLSSSKIVNYIMSSYANFHQKIKLIKFVQIARKNIINQSEIIKWKSSRRKQTILVQAQKDYKIYSQGYQTSSPIEGLILRGQQIQTVSMYLEN